MLWDLLCNVIRNRVVGFVEKSFKGYWDKRKRR